MGQGASQAGSECLTKLWSLHEMERTGGEPDVVGHDKKTGEYIFYDCSAESPKGRRSVCYDREALESRKEHKPEDNAIDMAAAMGIELLTEEQYRELQKLGEFDTKTSSWVKTPADIRKLGGALFCDRRYGHVFVYHNGARVLLCRQGVPRLAQGLIPLATYLRATIFNLSERLRMKTLARATLYLFVLYAISAPFTAQTTPRTPWGDPDLQGTWTTDDTIAVPIQRPPALGNKLFLTDEDLAQQAGGRPRRVALLSRRAAGAASAPVGPPDHWGESASKPVRQTSFCRRAAGRTHSRGDAGRSEARGGPRYRQLRRRSVQSAGRSDQLRSLHLARRRRLDAAASVRQRTRHRAGARASRRFATR